MSTSVASAESPSSTSSSLSETTRELFRLWCRSCYKKEKDDENDYLRAAASNFFSSLGEATEIKLDNASVIKTKSSHEQALAVLIQSLSPIWGDTIRKNRSSDGSATAAAAAAATATTTTTTEAVPDEKNSTQEKQVHGLVARQRALDCIAGALQGCGSSATLSPGLVQSLGDFLVKVAGPVVPNDDEDEDEDEDDEDPNSDLDEQLRDAALKTLQILLSSPLSPTNHDDASSSRTSKSSEDDGPAALLQRLDLALAAVQHRCAVPEFADDDNDAGARRGRVRSGLATLPRSRRSICFSVLEAPLKSFRSLKSTKDLCDKASNYIKFSASCLHGESDPRCLMQLLQLLNLLQQQLGPPLAASIYPASEVFDAVAPYYPIQFTPPPNDVHGITRQGLSLALWNVLYGDTQNDKALVRAGYESMMSLSLGLFLDTMNPPPEDGPATPKEQLDALECIHGLLLGVGSSALVSSDTPSAWNKDRILLLEATALRQIVDTVWAIHGDASRKLASDATCKKVAHQCRTFISELALAIEQATNTKSKSSEALFDTVVTQRLRGLSDQNPNDLAYLACLTSSGGVRCLQTCLEVGLRPRVEKLGNDQDQLSFICDGIAAIIAACSSGCERMAKRGVTMSPHPLEPYASKCLSALHAILKQNASVSAVRAVESLLSSSPHQIWKADLPFQLVEEILGIVLKSVVRDPAAMDVDEDEKWSECCVLGAAHFFALAENEKSQSLLAQEPIQSCVRAMFVRLVDSCSEESTGGSKRPDRDCLGQACRMSPPIAKQATSSILQSLVEDISKCGDNTLSLVESLSAVVRKGGANASTELQQISKGTTLLDLLQVLSNSDGDDHVTLEGVMGLSTLELPPTDEELDGLHKKIGALYQIILPIIPDYSQGVVVPHRLALVSALDKVLPPLNQKDTIKLSLLLPFVAKVIENPCELSSSERSSWKSATSYLADFCMGEETFLARKFAAQALHGILANIDSGDPCPVLPVMENAVLPAFETALNDIAKRKKSNRCTDKDITRFAELITFVGLLGSAATSRGASSAGTASTISKFLIDLAATSSASFDKDTAKPVSLPPDHGRFLSLVAGQAFGSVMFAASGKSISSQRTRYFATKRIHEIASSVKSITMGIVLVAAHLLCSLDIRDQPNDTLKLLLEFILGGFKILGSDAFEMPSSAKKVALAALVKIQTVRPDVVQPFLYTLVTGVLRAYVTTASSDSPRDVVAFKVLALQVLETVSTQSVSKNAFSRLKHAVIAILGSALNEKSSVLRHASVDVLNAWHAML